MAIEARIAIIPMTVSNWSRVNPAEFLFPIHPKAIVFSTKVLKFYLRLHNRQIEHGNVLPFGHESVSIHAEEISCKSYAMFLKNFIGGIKGLCC
jgi:hypothetical protein